MAIHKGIFEPSKTMRKRIFTAPVMVAVVAALVVLAGWVYTSGESLQVRTLVWVTSATLLVVAVLIVRMSMSLDSFYQHMQAQNTSLKEMEQLNQTLRSQRHDFLNQLQVIHGLLQLGEYQDADDYLSRVYGNIHSLGRVIRTAQPAVNALIAAKDADCARRGIHMELNISSQLDQLILPGWELCRVLGNLIDNAMEALGGKSGVVRLSVWEDVAHYHLQVWNDGPAIDEKHRANLFHAGYSTKEGDGRGMGLYITRQLLDRVGGRIDVRSDANGTEFEIVLPKQILAVKPEGKQRVSAANNLTDN